MRESARARKREVESFSERGVTHSFLLPKNNRAHDEIPHNDNVQVQNRIKNQYPRARQKSGDTRGKTMQKCSDWDRDRERPL